MSKRELYNQLRNELAIVMAKYKSPDLTIFLLGTEYDSEDEDTPSATALYVNGSINSLSRALGDSFGRMVLNFEKKIKNAQGADLRETALQEFLLCAMAQWDANPVQSDEPVGEVIDVDDSDEDPESSKS